MDEERIEMYRNNANEFWDCFGNELLLRLDEARVQICKYKCFLPKSSNFKSQEGYFSFLQRKEDTISCLNCLSLVKNISHPLTTAAAICSASIARKYLNLPRSSAARSAVVSSIPTISMFKYFKKRRKLFANPFSLWNREKQGTLQQ